MSTKIKRRSYSLTVCNEKWDPIKNYNFSERNSPVLGLSKIFQFSDFDGVCPHPQEEYCLFWPFSTKSSAHPPINRDENSYPSSCLYAQFKVMFVFTILVLTDMGTIPEEFKQQIYAACNVPELQNLEYHASEPLDTDKFWKNHVLRFVSICLLLIDYWFLTETFQIRNLELGNAMERWSVTFSLFFLIVFSLLFIFFYWLAKHFVLFEFSFFLVLFFRFSFSVLMFF